MPARRRIRLPRPPLLPLLAGLLLLATACGGDGEGARIEPGAYRLDRADYARALFRAHVGGAEPDAAARERLAARAKEAAAALDVRLDLFADGTFVVRYRYGEEEGRYGGTWTRSGQRVRMRVTGGPAGPLAEGEEVTATVEGDGLRFPASAVAHPFLLRHQSP